MYCKVCGSKTRKIKGVHLINDRWYLCYANYCHKHGSYIIPADLQASFEVVPNPKLREHMRPGLHVLVYLKERQKYQLPVEGYVRQILTNSLSHELGIKVLLTTGQVGRVCKILK